MTGSTLYLQQLAMHHRIRACLLAGIRSAVLWRQVGEQMASVILSSQNYRYGKTDLFFTLIILFYGANRYAT